MENETNWVSVDNSTERFRTSMGIGIYTRFDLKGVWRWSVYFCGNMMSKGVGDSNAHCKAMALNSADVIMNKIKDFAFNHVAADIL